MKRIPIEFTCYFEYRGVGPKEEWRFALYRVNVRPASVNDLVRDDGVHCFTVDCPGMNQGGKADSNREKNNPKRT
jgi:hypothetical protein